MGIQAPDFTLVLSSLPSPPPYSHYLLPGSYLLTIDPPTSFPHVPHELICCQTAAASTARATDIHILPPRHVQQTHYLVHNTQLPELQQQQQHGRNSSISTSGGSSQNEEGGGRQEAGATFPVLYRPWRHLHGRVRRGPGIERLSRSQAPFRRPGELP